MSAASGFTLYIAAGFLDCLAAVLLLICGLFAGWVSEVYKPGLMYRSQVLGLLFGIGCITVAGLLIYRTFGAL